MQRVPADGAELPESRKSRSRQPRFRVPRLRSTPRRAAPPLGDGADELRPLRASPLVQVRGRRSRARFGSRGPEWGSAVARGQVVHDVLEHMREEADLQELLEAALGRWDPDSPAPDSEPGREYGTRRSRARSAESATTQPIARSMRRPAAAASWSSCTWRRATGSFKARSTSPRQTEDGDRGARRQDRRWRCRGTEAQGRRLRASAQRVRRVRWRRSAVGRSARSHSTLRRKGCRSGERSPRKCGPPRRLEVTAALAAMGNDAPELTKHPAECRFCGYRKVGWCEGV